MNVTSVTETIKAFYKEYLVNHDAAGACKYLSESAELYGAGTGEYAKGIVECLRLLENTIQCGVCFDKVEFLDISEHKFGDNSLVMGKLFANCKEAKPSLLIRFSTCCIKQNNRYLIDTLHSSKEAESIKTDTQNTENYEQLSREIVSNIPIGLVIFSAENNMIRPIYFNDQACNIFGVSRSEFRKDFSPNTPFGRLRPSDCEKSLSRLHSAKHGATHEKVFDALRKDGKEISIRTVYSLSKKNGSTVFYASLKDISEELLADREARLKNEMYRILIDSVNANTIEYDIKSDTLCYRVHSAGDTEETIYNDFMLSLPQLGIISAKNSESVIKEIKQAIAVPGTGNLKGLFETEEGTRWLKISYATVGDIHGKSYRCIGKLDDIQNEIESEEKLKEAAEREAVLREVTLKDAMLSLEYDMATGNRIETEYDVLPLSFGKADTVFDIYHYALRQVIHPDDSPGFASLVSFGDSGIVLEDDVQSECRAIVNGKYRWVSINLSPVGSEENPHLYISVKDINKRKSEEQLLRDFASKDRLTGLLNRMSFEELCKGIIETDERKTEKAAFIILDLDDFKSINDNYGHIFGDKILISVASKLKNIFRSDDLVGRLGGDEMVVFIRDISTPESLRVKGEAICASISEIILADGISRLTCSVGIAEYPADGDNFKSLYENADFALYQAKNSGRNRYRIFSEKE